MHKGIVFWDWLGTLARPKVGLVPYAWALVDQFAKLGMKQVIVTNGGERETKLTVAIAPFRKFDLILTADQFPPKPDIAMFMYGLERCNKSNEDAIYIGDHAVDEEAAQKLNIDFFQVNGSLASYQRIAERFNFV